MLSIFKMIWPGLAGFFCSSVVGLGCALIYVGVAKLKELENDTRRNISEY